MRLNLQTDFALRLLTYLAAEDGERATIAEIARRFRISKNHLMKVAHQLGRHGLLKTVRGRAGGLRLAKPAASINIGDVVRQMENDFALVECMLDGESQCLITDACRLRKILRDSMQAFFDVLDRYTLQDLVVRNRPLKELLSQEAA